MRVVPRLAVASLLVTVLAGLGTASGAQTEPLPDTFTISARADGLLVELYLPQTPLIGTGGGLVDLSSASAQSLVNSLGRSTAYAGAPYPGEIIVGVPGLINGLGAGGLPPAPDYPLYVNSDFPAEPARRAEFGPYVLEAASESLTSGSSVEAGGSSGTVALGAISATAESFIDEESGLLVAEATSTVDPIAIGDLLSVGRIETRVRMEARPGELPEVMSSTDLGTITVAGIKVGLTDLGLELAGPLPGVGTGALTGLLSAADIEIEIVPAVQTETTYVSEGLRISHETEVPALGTVGVSYVVGRASVSISSVVSEPPATGELVPPVDERTAPPAAAPGPVPVDGLVLSSPLTPEVVAAPRPAPAPASARFVPSTLSLDAGRFYAAIVGAALVALIASRFLGVFGVRVWPRQVAPPPNAVRLRLPRS